MAHLNIEIKARCNRHDEIRDILHALDARYVGCDHQIDTHFMDVLHVAPEDLITCSYSDLLLNNVS